uniref:TPR repeat-containing protein n=1 Tax=Geobacter sp. (strain M21) TaxID=443144 RepID=C6E9B4_GEOSM
MLFGLFKKKDHRYYQAQGVKFLAAERYADARVDFLEALRLCPADAVTDQGEIRQGLDRSGNRLGELNLEEGEHCLNLGELQKAFDHFTLAAELAADQGIKAKAQSGLGRVQQGNAPPASPAAAAVTPAAAAPAKEVAGPYKPHGGGSCTSCGTHAPKKPLEAEPTGFDLADEDQFHLMVAPLPGDLPVRYGAMGSKFAQAYLMIHDGKDANALPVLQEMLLSGENDIVLYEVALIMFRAGRIHESQALLNRALSVNSGNGMAYLALVQLLAGGGRYAEAIALVERMLAENVMADQAQFILGELYETTGDEAKAIEMWSKALEIPTVARAAAEKLVPILGSQGRTEEVKYLAKKYLKGCC